MLFTNDQLSAIGAIKNGKNVMITGPGGTGKTTIINHLSTMKDVARPRGAYMGLTAMTGAAAVLIGGTTLHSYLGIGLGKDCEDDLVKKINGREKVRRKWRDTNMLIVDEVSMLSAELFDKLNRIAKRVRKRSQPFGGMQLVFGGDFLQLPCIKGDFCFESKAWRECGFEIFHLTKIMRQTDRQFQECLNRARFGELTDDDLEYITQRSVPAKDTMDIKPTRILCENVDVNDINKNELMQLPVEEVHKYKYCIDYDRDNYIPRTHEFMFKDIAKLCNAQPKLSLSVGAQVMLLVNTDVERGLVNGSRGVVTRFLECKTTNSKGEQKMRYFPVVRFGNQEATEMAIQKHGYEVKDGKDLIATIYQIPLKLAYAVTVHKSQGMTLDSAIIDLRGVFEYGQAYVALSRVRDVNNLFLINATKSTFKAHPKALEFYRRIDNQI